MVTTFSSQPLAKAVTWEVTVEEPDAIRWQTDVVSARISLNVNIIVPDDPTPRARLIRIVDRAILNAITNFDSNIDYIMRWFAIRYPDQNAKQFKRDMLKSYTLFIDFTEDPIKRELMFFETDLQHLGFHFPVTVRSFQ
jgi:hypothetical protein